MSEVGKLYYKTCREQAGLTQEEAAYLLGIKEVANLSRYENGHTVPSSKMVAQMVQVYRTPLLAQWHIWQTCEELRPYLPAFIDPTTNGDMFLQLSISDDYMDAAIKVIKTILKDGVISGDEIEDCEACVSMLKEIARSASSTVAYLESKQM